MPNQPAYRSQVLDHLGLVAGMFDGLGMGDVLDHATHHNPALRDLTVGDAVNARVLNGLGWITQARSRGPRFFQPKPTCRLMAPRMAPEPRNDDALGRALDTLYPGGVPALYRLLAATAAERLGLAPRFAHLDRTSFHVDGRYNSAAAPDEQVIQSTRGDSREHRPDLNQVMLELIVEPQAGSPVLMPPRSGHRSDAHACGQVIQEHRAPLQTTDGLTCRVADSALSSAGNRQQCAATRLKGIPRVPATLQAAQQTRAQADPQGMAPLPAGDCDHVWPSRNGGVAQRWVLLSSAPRQPQAPHLVDKPLLKQRAQAVHALKKLCRTALACEAEARQALATFAQGWQATSPHASTVCPTPRDGQRGRPSPGVQPDHVVYHLAGALASRFAARQALVEQQRGFLLATHALDDTRLPAQEL
jgi:transposase